MSLTLTTYCSDQRQAGIKLTFDLHLNIKLHRLKLVFSDYSFIKASSRGKPFKQYLCCKTFSQQPFNLLYLKNMRLKPNSEPTERSNAFGRSTSQSPKQCIAAKVKKKEILVPQQYRNQVNQFKQILYNPLNGLQLGKNELS